MIEKVCVERIRTNIQEKPMEEEMVQDTAMDTEIFEASEPSKARIKRTWEKSSSSKKKAKAHRKSLETSLTTYDVEMIVMPMEY
jgi:hypothetical protein